MICDGQKVTLYGQSCQFFVRFISLTQCPPHAVEHNKHFVVAYFHEIAPLTLVQGCQSVDLA